VVRGIDFAGVTTVGAWDASARGDVRPDDPARRSIARCSSIVGVEIDLVDSFVREIAQMGASRWRWVGGVIALGVTLAAQAFDAEGFEDGMTRQQVLKAATERFGYVEAGLEFVVATEPFARDDVAQVQFWFCDDALVMVKAVDAQALSVAEVMGRAAAEIARRGQPGHVHTRNTRFGGLGVARELTLLWATRPGWFNVMFEYYEKAEGVVSRGWFAENTCLRPYWLRDVPGGDREARDATPDRVAGR
jgi:hypothetical protein